MARSSGILLAFAVLWAGRVAPAQDAVPPRAGYEEAAGRLDAFVRSEMKAKGIPAVSVALVKGREVVWAKGFGVARAEGNVAATAKTVYRAGSVSKLFTDLAIMRLVERGQIDLDAPVSKYLKTFTPRNPFNTPITLRQLMAHRSGLCRESPTGNYFDATGPSLVETVESLNATELVYAPGARTKYSNAGVAVVGRVLEVVSGLPFEEAVRREVIGPLGLTESGFTTSRAIKAALADGLMWTYDGRTFPAPGFLLGTSAAGNLYSSVADLGKFLGVLLDGGKTASAGPLVTPDTLKAMWTPQFESEKGPRGFGLGFSLSTFDGRRRVGHGGAVYGFATEVAALPDDGLGVAVVSTKDCANTNSGRIADAALRFLLAVDQHKPLPALETTTPIAAGLAAKLRGHYGDADTGVELTARDGRLFLTPARGGFRQELKTLGDDLVTDDVLGYGTKVVVGDGSLAIDGKRLDLVDDAPPKAPPERWEGLIGEYGWDHNILYIHERGGRLFALIEWFFLDPLEEVSPDVFRFPDRGLYVGETLTFTRDAKGRALKVVAANVTFPRRAIGGEDGSTYRVKPIRPVAELRPEALAASPPIEAGEFRKPDLVDLAAVDPTVRYDVRYATDNNFLGTPFYTSARAFLQRPAASALAEAHRSLRGKGFGLLIHDAYRPWHVTRMFWDATPEAGRSFVADPAKGSKHNRGCAVDLTLFDINTGRPVAMPGGYDEFSNRSNPDYPGGTSLQRWRRDLLRRDMERQGFAVNEVEWWHFDFADWPRYPILNARFEELSSGR